MTGAFGRTLSMGTDPIKIGDIAGMERTDHLGTIGRITFPPQDNSFAPPHADRVPLIEHARIVWQGTPDRFAEEIGAGHV